MSLDLRGIVGQPIDVGADVTWTILRVYPREVKVRITGPARAKTVTVSRSEFEAAVAAQMEAPRA